MSYHVHEISLHFEDKSHLGILLIIYQKLEQHTRTLLHLPVSIEMNREHINRIIVYVTDISKLKVVRNFYNQPINKNNLLSNHIFRSKTEKYNSRNELLHFSCRLFTVAPPLSPK